MEQEINFFSGDLRLSGLLDHADSTKGVVISHPHPLYGGDMNNPVVECIQTAYYKQGYTTLRFDFRGTGKSQGTFDHGQGEQRDVCAAISALQQKGIDHIDLAGYSFGAWVNAHVGLDQAAYKRMVMISPPLGLISFEHISKIPSLSLVVTGSRDEIALNSADILRI